MGRIKKDGNRSLFLQEYNSRLALLKEYKAAIINLCTIQDRLNEDTLNFALVQMPIEKEKIQEVESLLKKIDDLPYGLRFGDVVPTKGQVKKLRNPFLSLEHHLTRPKSIIISETSRFKVEQIEDAKKEIKKYNFNLVTNIEGYDEESYDRIDLKEYKRIGSPTLYEIKHHTRRKMMLISKYGFSKEVSDNNTILLVRDKKEFEYTLARDLYHDISYQVQNRNINRNIEYKIYYDGDKPYLWQRLHRYAPYFYKVYDLDVVREWEDYIKEQENGFLNIIDWGMKKWEKAYGTYTYDPNDVTPPPF